METLLAIKHSKASFRNNIARKTACKNLKWTSRGHRAKLNILVQISLWWFVITHLRKQPSPTRHTLVVPSPNDIVKPVLWMPKKSCCFVNTRCLRESSRHLSVPLIQSVKRPYSEYDFFYEKSNLHLWYLGPRCNNSEGGGGCGLREGGRTKCWGRKKSMCVKYLTND